MLRHLRPAPLDSQITTTGLLQFNNGGLGVLASVAIFIISMQYNKNKVNATALADTNVTEGALAPQSRSDLRSVEQWSNAEAEAI